MEAVYTTQDIMTRYQCGRDKALEIIKEIPGLWVGRRKFVKERDLEDWQERHIEYPIGYQVKQRGIPRRR